MKTFEDYQERVKHWSKKVKPYTHFSRLQNWDWEFLFISSAYADIFMPQMEKEVCVISECPDRLLFVVYSCKATKEFWRVTEVSKIAKWFKKYGSGINPWKSNRL